MPGWRRRREPDPVVHEVPVDAELLGRALKVMYKYILPDDPATEPYFDYLDRVRGRVHLSEDGQIASVRLSLMESLIFVAGHTARILELGKRPEEAKALRADRARLQESKQAYVDSFCPSCNGYGYDYKVDIFDHSNTGWFPCSECEGAGIVSVEAAAKAG